MSRTYGVIMDEIKVSVIVPVYNGETYLEECMESILSQSYKNIEVIFVDDGSTDRSAELIQSFQERDHRVVLIRQTNQYAGIARNRGFDAATGKYVMFLDADDYFDSSLVEKMVSAMQRNHADIAICKSRGYDEKAKKEHQLAGALNLELLPEKEVFSKEDVPEYIFQLTAGWAWDKMYRAGFIREKNLRFQGTRVANDELFVDLSLGEAEAIVAVRDELVIHRTNVITSIEYTRERFWHCGYEMLAEEKKELESRGLFPMLKRSFVNRAAKYITWNVCSITTAEYFSEYYSFLTERAIEELEIVGYPSEYYDDPFVCETLHRIEKLSEIEFLCTRIRELNQTVAERDLYVQELLSDMGCLQERMRWMKEGKRWIFPDSLMPDGARVVIYGFGDVGSYWFEDIQRSGRMKLVMVVDKNYDRFETDAVKIHPVEDVDGAEYDYILIAVNEKETADEIRGVLTGRKIAPEKILWFDPSERGTK